jgi:hypothetical protein
MKSRRERHCGARCMDDICRGTLVCLIDGMPIGEECPVCGVETIAEYGEMCACEEADEAYEYGYEDDDGAFLGETRMFGTTTAETGERKGWQR